MTFDATHTLRFVNRARLAMGHPALTELRFVGAVLADERHCVLARALRGEVGGSQYPAWDGAFVLRVPDQALAEAVAAVTGQPCNDRAEVLLPDAVTNVAVGFDHGRITGRGARYLPAGQLCFEDLELRPVRGGNRRTARTPAAGLRVA